MKTSLKHLATEEPVRVRMNQGRLMFLDVEARFMSVDWSHEGEGAPVVLTLVLANPKEPK